MNDLGAYIDINIPSGGVFYFMVGKPSLWEVRGTRFEAAPAIWKEKEQVGGLSKVSWKEKVQLGLMPSCIPAGSPLSQPPALSEHCPVGCSVVLSWAGFTETPPCSSLKPGPFTRAVGPGGCTWVRSWGAGSWGLGPPGPLPCGESAGQGYWAVLLVAAWFLHLPLCPINPSFSLCYRFIFSSKNRTLLSLV